MNSEEYSHPMLFSNEQNAVIEDAHPFRLTIAGAGSGKTYTLTGQIWKWILEGVEPRGIVAITFTNIGADELRKRIPAQLGRLGFIGTLHSWCLHLLNRYGAAIGYAHGRVSMIDEDTEEALIKEAIKENRGKNVPISEVRSLKGTTRKARPAEIIARAYCQKLRASNAVDFDTVLIEALRLLEGGHVPEMQALLVDEYQDSGELDALIYKAAPALRKFIVGDPDQAIFPFRGGRLENILELAADPAWHVHYLNDNYRSVPSIVHAANRLIEHNETRLKKTMRPGREGGMKMISTFPQKSPMSEAAFIARSIADGCSKEGGQKPKDFAVLARYNAYLPGIAAAIQAEGLPVIFKEEKPHPWLSVAVAALNALFAPDNDVLAAAWLAKIKSPRTAYAELMHRGLLDLAHGKAIHAMELPPEALHAITAAWCDDPTQTIARLIESQSEDLPKGDGVYVSTIHGSKGGEWPNVIIAQAHAEALPGRKTGEELECERRLFYVGITRAREACMICYSEKAAKTYAPALINTEASPFIAEADA